MLDILIRGGQVFDGTGAPPQLGDVAIAGERIAAVEPLPEASARTVIEATGLAVAPGFIDFHSHADYTLPVLPTADSKVHQGFTLEVVGNCGSSPAPLNERLRQEMIAKTSKGGTNMAWPGMAWEWDTFASYLDWLRCHPTSINVATYVGHGAIRSLVLGQRDVPPSPEQLGQMQDEVRLAMQAGAVGISTGLIYPPGVYATLDEIAALAQAAAVEGGIYATHMRSEADTLLEAISEALEVGRRSRAPVQISHLKASGPANWGKMAHALRLIEAAQAEGLDVAADMYPYTAGCTYVGALLPAWCHDGGPAALMEQLRDPVQRGRIRREMMESGLAGQIGWDAIYVSYCPVHPEYDGCTMSEVAAARGQEPEEAALDLALETEEQVEMIIFIMLEENVAMGLRRRWVMIGTDGEGRAPAGQLSAGKPHPRNYGTAARVLGHYSRDGGLFPLAEAVRKLTGLPAARLGLRQRGLLRRGYYADVVVFDPATVTDRATFTNPHQFPAGIPWVLVNGQIVIAGGAHTGARPGQVVSR